MKPFALVFAALLLSGCGAPNLVGLQGNALDTRYSLQDRREAKLHIKVTPTLPEGAIPMKEYSTERCRQYAQTDAPSNDVVTDDLVMLAYAEGADGLTGLKFTSESGLLKNCWSITRGTALFYRLPQARLGVPAK